MNTRSSDDLPVRGVCWVLSRALAGLALLVGGTQLVVFFLLLAAEQQLATAAEAGLRETALPRASLTTVREVVRGELPLPVTPSVLLVHNGHGRVGQLAVQPGDHLLLSVSVATRDVLPGWLPPAALHLAGEDLRVTMEQTVP